MDRRCEQCGGGMGLLMRAHARYCSTACKQRAYRARRVLPRELTSRPRWVRRAVDKRPLTTSGAPASVTDAHTWSSYDAARRSAAGEGIGFVLNGDGIVCIDLDHCVSGGRVAEWARRILTACPPTYIETSASGTGLHIWGIGHVDRGRRIRAHGRSVEVYGDGRYIALGTRHERAVPHLADLSGVIPALT